MRKTKEEKEEFVRMRKADIGNYIRSLKAMLCLRDFIINKMSGEFYFGGSLNYVEPNERAPQTPDIITKFTDNVWVGEIKKSLRDPGTFQNKDEYIKEYIEKKIIAQLKKYDEPFKELKVSDHDLILMAPQFCNEAIGYLKVDYLEKHNPFTNNFALVVYSIESGANGTEFIMVKLEYGKVKSKDAQDLLLRGHRKMLGELKDDFGRYKIYEENRNTPIEYLMVILWTSIFPEIMKKSSKDRIIEWRTNNKNTFEVKIDLLMEYLHKLYTLPSFTNNNRTQFQRDMVIEAMKKFREIGYVEDISTDKEIIFRVTYKSLPEKKEIDSILKALYLKTEEIKKSPIKSSKNQNLTKWMS